MVAPPRLIRDAVLADLDELGDLCLRSKAHWGYDADFMAACRDELTLKPDDLARSRVALLAQGGRLLAVVQLTLGHGPAAELEKLFVAPEAIGCGAGRDVLGWAADRAREAGAERLECDADPHAEGFYLRAGAVRVGMVPSGSWPGRMLPRMMLRL
ncbi:GNAT family N-acetyltransferase [Paracoccus sp. M683]|uniref:GNAT family N-acetyltransferase n=1 Tax=Paracoccus sp. M683 TaxID=2594268 RepID=UPI001181767C|nr:GNAT family N-acetyltransferase [Paracoccus sp. M683]TRW96586.1 GNAT family N-acetyltransferase [Paracoccus sp. M683]